MMRYIIINAFMMANPDYTVSVVDNGATATLEMNIINGNKAKVDLFLAADTVTSACALWSGSSDRFDG
jgi:hypothetical protein